MTTYTFIFIVTFIIVVISMFCILMNSFIKRVSKSKDETEFEGEFELFKLFKFKFKAKHKNNKK